MAQNPEAVTLNILSLSFHYSFFEMQTNEFVVRDNLTLSNMTARDVRDYSSHVANFK